MFTFFLLMRTRQASTNHHFVLFLLLFGIFSSGQSLPYKKSVQHCNQFFHAIDCYYFSCIDAIYQCGPENLLVQFSYPYCDATLEQTFTSLTRSGQIWANSTQKCLMQELDYFLRTNPSVTCAEIDRYVLNKYPICLAQSHPNLSLCSIICQNLEVFFQIFENWNLNSLNLKRLLLETSHLCPEQSQMEYVIDLEQSTIRTIFWSLCLDSLKTKLRNFHPNEIMIRISEKSGIFAEMIEEEN